MPKSRFIVFSLFFLLFAPTFVQAADFVVEVDTGTETINALEAEILIPAHLGIEKIYTGNSAILFWIEAPNYNAESKTISFSGITPGGFSGKKMVLIFYGHFDEADLKGFSFSNVRALKNDGAGTVAPVTLFIKKTQINADLNPPELFKPVISSSPDLFDGRRFLSFATQDKGTGVEYYEYASAWFLSPRDDDWLVVESPMVLSQRALFQKNYIRAVDSSSNEQSVFVVGPYYYASVVLGTIMLLCVLLLLRRLARYFY